MTFKRIIPEGNRHIASIELSDKALEVVKQGKGIFIPNDLMVNVPDDLAIKDLDGDRKAMRISNLDRWTIQINGEEVIYDGNTDTIIGMPKTLTFRPHPSDNILALVGAGEAIHTLLSMDKEKVTQDILDHFEELTKAARKELDS
jgi:hypothetical protein